MLSRLVTRTSALTNPVAHDALLSVKAPFSELPPELCGVVAALLQPLFEILCVGLHGTCVMSWLAFWKAVGPHPAAYGSAIETELAADLNLTHATLRQVHNLFVSAMAPFPVFGLP